MCIVLSYRLQYRHKCHTGNGNTGMIGTQGDACNATETCLFL